MSAASTWPCPLPFPDAFGLSPTFSLCGCECPDCPPDAEMCGSSECSCGQLDLKIDDDGRLVTSGQVTHHVLTRLGYRRRVADNDQRRFACEDRGGWWAEELFTENGFGNLNWTLEWERPTSDTANTASAHITESQQDLVDAGVISDVDISATVDACGCIDFSNIEICPRSTNAERQQYSWMWETEVR